MSRCLRIAALAAALALAPAGPRAAPPVSCTIGTPGGLAFGTYDPRSPAALTIPPGSCSINCTGKGPVVVTLSRGASGVYFPRQMKSGAQALNYNIYWDNTYAQVWGDGTGGTVSGPFTSPWSPTAQYFGSIPAGQDVPAGIYTDSITLSVIF